MALPEEMLDLAAHLIRTKAATFDVSRYEDRYENALIDLVKAKQEGRELQPAATPRPSNVINLMDALRRSIATEKAEAAHSEAQSEQRLTNEQPHGLPSERMPKRRAEAARAKGDKVRKSPRPKKQR